MGHIHKVIQVFLVKEEALVTLESLVSLVFLGVKVSLKAQTKCTFISYIHPSLHACIHLSAST